MTRRCSLFLCRVGLLAATLWLAAVAAPATAQEYARDLFGAATTPVIAADGQPHAIGSYAKGCIAGAVQLPADGPGWQAMRLSRDRRWGHPLLVEYLGSLAAASQADGWPGLLVGDMGQPRGGPMKSGHASHQSGLDVDIWFQPMPGHTMSAEERESLSAQSVLKKGSRTADPDLLGQGQRLLIYRAASLPGVSRVFVAPGIKQALCNIKWRDPSFLNKVRPWYGHDDHLHVRLECPPGDTACEPQTPPSPGDGCGEELAYWFTDEPYKPSNRPPAEPLTLADLPPLCTQVVNAGR